jgi:hypothetical protein
MLQWKLWKIIVKFVGQSQVATNTEDFEAMAKGLDWQGVQPCIAAAFPFHVIKRCPSRRSPHMKKLSFYPC